MNSERSLILEVSSNLNARATIIGSTLLTEFMMSKIQQNYHLDSVLRERGRDSGCNLDFQKTDWISVSTRSKSRTPNMNTQTKLYDRICQ